MMGQDKEKEEVSSKRRHEHAQEVRKQVREKEREKVTARKVFFEEGIKLDHEAKERSEREGREGGGGKGRGRERGRWMK